MNIITNELQIIIRAFDNLTDVQKLAIFTQFKDVRTFEQLVKRLSKEQLAKIYAIIKINGGQIDSIQFIVILQIMKQQKSSIMITIFGLIVLGVIISVAIL